MFVFIIIVCRVYGHITTTILYAKTVMVEGVRLINIEKKVLSCKNRSPNPEFQHVR